MKKLILTLLFTFIPGIVFPQAKKGLLEITPYVRFDKYPQFSYVIQERPTTDYVDIKGSSFGINVMYKIPISKSLFIKPGIGYYKYSFDDIKKENTLFGKSVARDINYISPVYILFYTDKYWYHSIAFNMGIEETLYQNKTFELNAGLNLCNYFTFSQYYHLRYNPAGGQDFKKKRRDYFGTSIAATINPIKKLGKVCIGPSLIIPVYDSWKTDQTFQEESNSGTRNKWLNGIGVGITIQYALP
ncbi:hypothetical protein [Chitinophaga sp. MM2321]|uniref:hypothetical protein n=1 Tax=Chitinophaga sp. MM2321 TaxID=3137178 RepID=UPI0032D593A2